MFTKNVWFMETFVGEGWAERIELRHSKETDLPSGDGSYIAVATAAKSDCSWKMHA